MLNQSKIGVKLIQISILLISNSVLAQNVKTGNIIDLFLMSDSLNYDLKNIGFGGSYSADNFNVNGDYKYLSSPNTNFFNIGYYRYYIPIENNHNNFVLLNSISINYGKESFNNQGSEKCADIYSFKRAAGIGYKFSYLMLVPYTSRSTLNYKLDGEKFGGRKREMGISLNAFNFIGLSFSYNNTIFGENDNLIERLASRGIESLGNKLLDIGIESILPNNKYYPIYYWLANIAFKTMFISINRNNYNFPFNNKKQFEVSSYNLSVQFEINLFSDQH